MESSQFVLAQLWLYAFLLGIGLGAVYDALRITRVFLGISYTKKATAMLRDITLPYLPPRHARRTSRVLGVVIFLEDFLFALFVGVSMILLFYLVNNGNIRFHAFLCTLLGFFLYRMTFGRIVMLGSEIIAFGVETILRYAVFFTCLPFRWLWKQFSRICARLWLRLRTYVLSKKRKALTACVLRDAEICACGLIPHTIQTGRIKKEVRHDQGEKEAV